MYRLGNKRKLGSQSQYSPKIQNNRRRRGFSLPTILCIGVIACLWMLSTAAIVIPAAGRVTKERVADMARSSAEAGLDWAVAQLNDPSTRPNVDHQTVNIPSDVMALSSFTGTVRVTDCAAPTSSYLYDQTCDWSRSSWNNSATSTCNNVYGGNGWRLLTATVTAGTNVRSVRVILKPIYSATTQSAWVPGSPVPFFGSGMQMGQGISVPGSLVTNAYASTQGNPLPSAGFQEENGDLVTNGIASIEGSSVIGGNIKSFSSLDGAIALSDNAVVKKDVVTNGTATGTLSGVVGQVTTHAALPTASFPPAPSPPSDATPITIALNGSQTMTLSNGNYVTSTISISDSSQLHVDTSSGPVNVYVNGSGSSTGITIGGNGIAHAGRPVNFRIWYGGSGNVQIGGASTFSGCLYAPNAQIRLNGNGTIYGGLVGSTLLIHGTPTFHFDTNLISQGPMFFPPVMVNKEADVINHYQAVSWYEY